jgi:hypothetical protein
VLRPRADDAYHLRPRPLVLDVELAEDARREPVRHPEQPEQQVLGADVIVAERARVLLRAHDDLPGPHGETLEHGAKGTRGGIGRLPSGPWLAGGPAPLEHGVDPT